MVFWVKNRWLSKLGRSSKIYRDADVIQLFELPGELAVHCSIPIILGVKRERTRQSNEHETRPILSIHFVCVELS